MSLPSKFHIYQNGQWANLLRGFLPTDVIATGGVVTNIVDGGVDYRVHTFTTSGDFEVEVAPIGSEVEYLIIGGGGGAGWWWWWWGQLGWRRRRWRFSHRDYDRHSRH
jgi:hypothetical protein